MLGLHTELQRQQQITGGAVAGVVTRCCLSQGVKQEADPWSPVFSVRGPALPSAAPSAPADLRPTARRPAATPTTAAAPRDPVPRPCRSAAALRLALRRDPVQQQQLVQRTVALLLSRKRGESFPNTAAMTGFPGSCVTASKQQPGSWASCRGFIQSSSQCVLRKEAR